MSAVGLRGAGPRLALAVAVFLAVLVQGLLAPPVGASGLGLAAPICGHSGPGGHHLPSAHHHDCALCRAAPGPGLLPTSPSVARALVRDLQAAAVRLADPSVRARPRAYASRAPPLLLV